MKQNILTTPAAEVAVRAYAYRIWEEEGRPEGRHDLHWQRAMEWFASQVKPAAVAPRAQTTKAKAISKKK